MIRSGREPRDKSEKMILNNFHAMQRIGEVRSEPLTVELICEIHRIVTEGTLNNPDAAGRFQRPEDNDRVSVWDDQDELLHQPPPAVELPERVQRLCDFANGATESTYLPGVLRALTVHFMIGYEHPFEDGNGRTARALFYWSMLNQGHWLTEFLSVSRILKRAPGRYARSFLYTETDENDLTYFFSYHLDILHRAIDELHAYLAHKMDEVREVRRKLRQASESFGPRQLALLQHALKHPTYSYTVQSHKTSHRVSTETARVDLRELEHLGLLGRRKIGKRFVFEPVDNLSDAIRSLAA
jgi:Fic family protein